MAHTILQSLPFYPVSTDTTYIPGHKPFFSKQASTWSLLVFRWVQGRVTYKVLQKWLPTCFKSGRYCNPEANTPCQGWPCWNPHPVEILTAEGHWQTLAFPIAEAVIFSFGDPTPSYLSWIFLCLKEPQLVGCLSRHSNLFGNLAQKSEKWLKNHVCKGRN